MLFVYRSLFSISYFFIYLLCIDQHNFLFSFEFFSSKLKQLHQYTLSIFFFLRFLWTILILSRINDVLEQQIELTKKTNTKGKNFLEQHPPKEVGLRPH